MTTVTVVAGCGPDKTVYVAIEELVEGEYEIAEEHELDHGDVSSFVIHGTRKILITETSLGASEEVEVEERPDFDEGEDWDEHAD